MLKGIDELRELNQKLTVMLESPEPGTAGWRIFLSDLLIKMAGYAGRGDIEKILQKYELIIKR